MDFYGPIWPCIILFGLARSCKVLFRHVRSCMVFYVLIRLYVVIYKTICIVFSRFIWPSIAYCTILYGLCLWSCTAHDLARTCMVQYVPQCCLVWLWLDPHVFHVSSWSCMSLFSTLWSYIFLYCHSTAFTALYCLIWS